MVVNIKYLLYPFCLMAAVTVQAQPTMSSRFETVGKAGFYRVPIDPEWAVILKEDLSDLRIKDEKGRAVGYVEFSYPQHYSDNGFRELSITKNERDSKNRSVIEVMNNATEIANISFIMDRAAVYRKANLSGSDDGMQWYTIAEDITFIPSTSGKNGYFEQGIDLVAAKWKYFRLTIENKKSDPLHIIKAGYHLGRHAAASHSYNGNPALTTGQRDSGRYTIITAIQKKPYPFHELSISVKGPKFYHRRLELFNAVSGERILEGEISSDNPYTDLLWGGTGVQGCDTIRIVIDNLDDAPLTVTGVTTRYIQRSVVAWFEPGNYTFEGGDKNAQRPEYDLEFFRDSIQFFLPDLRYGNITPLEVAVVSATKPKQTNTIIWIVIGITAVVLGFFSYRLVREMKQKEENS